MNNSVASKKVFIIWYDQESVWKQKSNLILMRKSQIICAYKLQFIQSEIKTKESKEEKIKEVPVLKFVLIFCDQFEISI